MPDPLITPRVLWIALCLSQLMLGGLAFVLPSEADAPAPMMLAVALAAVSVGIAVVSFVLPANVAAKTFKLRGSLVELEPDPEAVPLYREGAPKIRILRANDATLRALVLGWQPPFILSMALSEAVTLNGFVLSRIGFEAPMVAPFVAAGLLLSLARWPSRARILASAARALTARVVDAPQ